MSATAQQLWQRLAAAGLVQGEPPPTPLAAPWYVRLLLGVAGWIAALFLLGFVAAGMAWLAESQAASIVGGLLVSAAAWVLFRKMPESAFAQQFALAFSFAGQALFALGVFGLYDHSAEGAGPWLWIAVQQAVLLAVMPNTVHRLWSAFAASVTLYMALRAGGLGFLVPPLLLAAAAWGWLHEFRWPRFAAALRPGAYGLVIALIGMELAGGLLRPAVGFDAPDPERRLWGQMLNGAVLVGVVWVLLHRTGATWPGRTAVVVLAGTVLTVLVSLEAPGIATGVCILLLGFAHGNAVLTGLGGIALLLYAGDYYYELDVTLLVKSQVLAATGAVLLGLRWVLLRWLGRPAGQAADG
jgi:hypothetical protein